MNKHDFAENMSFIPIFALYLELEREMNKLKKNLELVPKEQYAKFSRAFYLQRVKCKDLACRYIWDYSNEGLYNTLWEEKFQKLCEISNLRSEAVGKAISTGNLADFERLCEEIRKEFHDAMAAKCTSEMLKLYADAFSCDTEEYIPFWEELGVVDEEIS